MSSFRKANLQEINVIKIHSKASIYGMPPTSTSLTKDMEFIKAKLSVCNKDREVKCLYMVVKYLDEVLKPLRPDKKEAFKAFWGVMHQIHETGKKEDGERLTKPSESANWLKFQILQDLSKTLRRFVMSYTLFPFEIAHKHEKGDILLLRGIALEIFFDIFVYFENLAEIYSDDHDFLVCLFTHLQYVETCFPACRVLESLLLSRKTILDLTTIDYFKEMVGGFNDVALGNFCKILCVTLSELDMYEHKTSLYEQTKEKKTPNFYARDINLDTVLKIHKILPKLVNLACAKPYVPWFSAAIFESEQWLKWIDNQLTEERDGKKPTQFIGGMTQWDNTGPLESISSSKIASELNFRADAVCVLGLLLAGRHRKEVQKELADLQLIPRLSDLFDHFIWRANRCNHARLPGHNSSCECSPAVALKIQVLRLIHSYCDHSDFKHVMLSWCEFSEFKGLEESYNSSPAPWLNRDVMCVGSKGLLTKIVDVLKKESETSTFRFWLSRALESYLRGSLSGADQDFLLRRQLLHNVVSNLLISDIHHKEIIQSSFDLLGELIRFNTNTFREINSFCSQISRQRQLLHQMNSCLVDSNMFIRSLILSFESFKIADNKELKTFVESDQFLLTYIGSFNVRVYYLKKLLGLINVHNLTQENVSCLNTALVILMFALKNDVLPQYLHMLATSREACSIATNEQSGMLDNLKALLVFWQDHYLQKDKDCTVLEKSTRIPFLEWKKTVTIMTSDDALDPNSIVFYTNPAISSRAS